MYFCCQEFKTISGSMMKAITKKLDLVDPLVTDLTCGYYTPLQNSPIGQTQFKHPAIPVKWATINTPP